MSEKNERSDGGGKWSGRFVGKEDQKKRRNERTDMKSVVWWSQRFCWESTTDRHRSNPYWFRLAVEIKNIQNAKM